MACVQLTGVARERVTHDTAVTLAADVVVATRVLVVVADSLGRHVRTVDVPARVRGQRRRLERVALVVHRVPAPNTSHAVTDGSLGKMDYVWC